MRSFRRAHNPHLHRRSAEDLAATGRAIRLSLAAMRARLGDLAYNVMFHSAPYRVRGDYHWHTHILPKATPHGAASSWARGCSSTSWRPNGRRASCVPN